MSWSSRNILATHNLLAVSATQQESAINTAQGVDTTLLVNLDNVLNYLPVRESNRHEATGQEEPTRLDDLGGLVKGNLDFSRAQPQHFAFLLGYGLGQVTSAPAGVNGYRHTITPRRGNVDLARGLPSFTAVQRLGQQVMKRRFVSCFVDQIKVLFPKDGWAQIKGTVQGTGKFDDNTGCETIVAPYNASVLTLSNNGVSGNSVEERLSNVQAIKVLHPSTQAWVDVGYSAVSEATPAVITINPPGSSADNTSFRVWYIPTETGWMNLPPRVSEPPLRATQWQVNVGGKWTGTGLEGGHLLAAELRDLSWTVSSNLILESTPGAGGLSANRAIRPGRSQKLVFDRDFCDFVMKQHLADNDYLVVHLQAEGPEFEPGYRYAVEIVFPKVGINSSTIGMTDRRLGEKVEFAVLEDELLGSVLVHVQNQVAAYAA